MGLESSQITRALTVLRRRNLVRGLGSRTAQSGFHMYAYPFKGTGTSNLPMYAQRG